MTCPSCGTEYVAGQKFCMECGSALAATCPNCGVSAPAGAKFCMECGSTLTEADPTPAAPAPDRPEIPERRFVSVLFADLVGFTSFSESRDPEDVRGMLTKYFDRSRAIVERYSGEVDKFIGDALMAVWGAVEAHEDDAERATRAALDLVDMVAELGAEIGVPELRLRAGVLTGETSVGPGGNEKGLVVGDLVNTASRLQSIAEPGTVLVGGATFELVNHVIEFTAMGDHEMKGKAEPVATFRAERVVAGHGGRRRADTVEPPFVGRDDELRLLKDQFHAVGREGRGRLISIVGDAGIGKSRLVWELFKYVDGLPEATYWHQGRSPSYGEGLTFWSLGEMVRRRAGIAETDEPAKSRMKLRTALAEYVPDDDERRWLEPWLAGILGLDPMPEGDRAELFSTLRTFFHRVADLGQTVLVFEDLHWADEGVLEFIQDLLDRSQRQPILVVTLARPELLDGHPGWGSGRSATAVRLAPLPDDEMATLVTGVVPGVPHDAVAAVVERAAGIPLYAVEFIRMLLASGEVERDGDRFRLTGDLSELSLPDSLQAVVGSRIDRLSAEDRALVQDAAVLGQSFVLDGLQALGGGSVDELAPRMLELVRKELFELDDDPRSPERGMYHFVQSVVREVAYGRLSRSDRYEAHRKVAAYFEDIDDPELAGAVAGHLMAAREAAPEGEGDALVERALGALQGAAGRAAGLHSHAQVLSLCEQALEIADDDPGRVPFWMLAARAADALADEERGAEFATRAIAAAEALADEPARLEATTLLGSILAGNWHANEAVATIEPVYEQLTDLGTPEAVTLAAEMGRALMLAGEPLRSVEVCDRALAAAEPLEMTRTVIDAIITKGTALGNALRPSEAMLILHGAADLADRHDLPWLAVRALNNLAVVQGELDPQRTAETGYEIFERVKRLGDLRWLLQAYFVIVSDKIQDGLFDEALAVIAEGRSEDPPEFWQKWFDFRETVIEMVRDPSDDATERARELLTYWDDSTDPQLRAIVDLSRVEVEMLAGNRAEAFRRAREVSDASDSFEMWGLWEMARSAAWLRDADLVAATLRTLDNSKAVGRYAAAARAYLEGAAAALAGDRDGAAAAFGAAVGDLERVGKGDDLVIARATFAALVGQDHPAAAEAARLAQEWITECGATALQELLAEGLPADAAEATGTG